MFKFKCGFRLMNVTPFDLEIAKLPAICIILALCVVGIM